MTSVDVQYQRAPGLSAEFGGMPPGPTLSRLLEHFRLAWSINAVVELGLADAVGDEPRSAEEIAASVGADATMVYRLLRALACHDIFTETSPGHFALTPLAACLRRDSHEYGWAAVRWFLSPHTLRYFQGLTEVVRTGRARGDYFDELRQDPQPAAIFDAFQASNTSGLTESILAAYDFSPFRTLVDVGGGDGTLLACILAAYPQARGILFDLPSVVEHAARRFQEAGLLGRVGIQGGDFFERVPPGGDAYVLKGVLHDWDDAPATRILQSCRSVLRPDSTLLVIEAVLPPGNAPSYGRAWTCS
jgi:hypothetical protein